MKKRLIILAFLLVVFQASGNKFVSSAETISLETDQQKPELILQTGHSKSVLAVVFSPDNKWAASGSFDNTIKLWDIETGRELRALTGHSGAVKTLACSPDGRRLASGGNDKTVKLWDVESGQEIRSFEAQNAAIETVAFSSDGQNLAAGNSGNRITVWNTATGQERLNLSDHTASVTALTFSPDGKFLASGSADKTIILWDTGTGKKLKTLTDHTDKITVLRFNETGEILASGSPDQTVRLWNTSKGRNLAMLTGHTGRILAIDFISPDKLMSADSNRTVKVWDTTVKRVLSSVGESATQDSTGEAESAGFSRDGRFLATGNGDRTAAIFDTKTVERLKTLENRTSGYYGVTFSADRRWLAAASNDNTVKLWDLHTGQSLPPLVGHTGYVKCVVFHPDNRRIISGSIDHTIRIWDTLSTKPPEILKGHTNSINSLAIGSKGKLLVSGSLDKTIGLWDLDAKTPGQFLKGHSDEVISVAISPDEQLIASASLDTTIKLWDVSKRTLVRTLEHSAEVDAVAFSPDGKFIASGGVDKTVRVWETATGILLKTLTGHTEKINAVLFSPDGTQIASASRDKTVRIWNVSDGREIGVKTGHVGAVFAISFSLNGQWLASASDDGSIIIWRKESGERLATLISLRNSEDWLVVTPEGFFDGSSASWEQLAWRFEKDTFNVKPVEVYFSEFYFPGLLSDLLNDGKLPSDVTISQKDRRQPHLKLIPADAKAGSVTAERNLKVKIEVSQAPAGAQDLRLFRNGSLVRIWRGDVLKGQQTVTLEATLPIVAGENILTVYAFNRDNIKSSDAALTVRGDDRLKRKGVSYILSVGVNVYANNRYTPNLTFAVADATDFADEVKRQQEKIGNFERIEVIRLNDREATKIKILTALIDLTSKTQPEDSLVIFFAGHGTAEKNHFYLIPHDLPLDADSLETILTHSMSDVELQSAVEGLDVGQMLVVIDACNSGQALEAEEKRRGPMNSKGLAQIAYEKGMYILTAAQSFQLANENERLGHGFLTYALVEEGLKTSVADRQPKDGQVLLREWLDFATERVPQIHQDNFDKTRELIREKPEGKSKDKSKADAAANEKNLQRPRVFYRRNREPHPLVVAKQ